MNGPSSKEQKTQQQVDDKVITETAENRISLADEYFKKHLEGQRGWYDKKATRCRRWHSYLSLVIILAAAMTSFTQIFGGGLNKVTIITAALGVVVIMAKGVEEIWAFKDTWIAYRKASESMKREYRLFINNAGAYRNIPDDEQAYVLFVERTECIIAEEQKIYWSNRQEGADEQDKQEKRKG